MTLRIIWAQALDNTSSDHFEISDGELTREAAVSRVYNVIERGRRVYAQDSVRLTASGQELVLELESAVKDLAGRTAPIVCLSGFDADLSPGFAAGLASDVDGFANRIGRKLAEGHSQLVANAIATLKKNCRRRVTMVTLFILTIILCLAGLVYEGFFVQQPAQSAATENQWHQR